MTRYMGKSLLFLLISALTTVAHSTKLDCGDRFIVIGERIRDPQEPPFWFSELEDDPKAKIYLVGDGGEGAIYRVDTDEGSISYKDFSREYESNPDAYSAMIDLTNQTRGLLRGSPLEVAPLDPILIPSEPDYPLARIQTVIGRSVKDILDDARIPSRQQKEIGNLYSELIKSVVEHIDSKGQLDKISVWNPKTQSYEASSLRAVLKLEQLPYLPMLLGVKGIKEKILLDPANIIRSRTGNFVLVDVQ